MIIAWISKHNPVPRQVEELVHLFGEVDIRQDIRPFGDAAEIVRRVCDMGAEEAVVVAPLSVVSALCDAGLTPIRAEMEQLPCADPGVEVRMGNRCYRHKKFVRVMECRIITREITPWYLKG